jgi:hypothetical protein
MKKLNFLFVLMVILLASSCNKDENLIVGTWKAASFISAECDNPEDNFNMDFINGCFSQSDLGFSIEVCMEITFNKDKTYSTLTTSSFTFEGETETETETETGTYTITGDILKLCDGAGSCDEGTFAVTKTTLTLFDLDSEDGCKTEFRMTKK